MEKSYKSYWEQNVKKSRYLKSGQIFVKPEIFFLLFTVIQTMVTLGKYVQT